jgi:hypothetical protein
MESMETIPYIAEYYDCHQKCALEKCFNTDETLTGFSSPPLWLPRCDNPPNRYYIIIAQRRGGMGGQALSPPSSNQYFVSHIKEKEFYRAQKCFKKT